MNFIYVAIGRHLKFMGRSGELGAWVPYELSEKHRETQHSIVFECRFRHRVTRSYNDMFLDTTVTGERKVMSPF